MPHNVTGLKPEFADALLKALADCAVEGLDVRIGQKLRSADEQAEIYSRNRSQEKLDVQVAKLRAGGAPFLAELLDSKPAQPDKPWGTDALPGMSWHQWGEAADCYVYRNNVMVKSGADPAYRVYADIVQARSLTAGLFFTKPDAGQVQLRPAAGPQSVLSLPAIDAEMRRMAGAAPHAAGPAEPVAATVPTQPTAWAPFPSEVAVVARTVWGEARGESGAGKIAVAWVIRNRWIAANRVDKPVRSCGQRLAEICRHPRQFSCWNDPESANWPEKAPENELMPCREAVVAAFAPDAVDPTGGCEFFFNPDIVQNPFVGAGFAQGRKIDHHQFVKRV